MPSEIAGCVLMTDNLPSLSAATARAGEQTDACTHIIERAVAGDAAAFEQLMIAHERRVVATAWRLLGDREDARDAAQEVFLRVYKYLHRYRPGQDFQGWLYRITVNVCHDVARKRRAHEGGGRQTATTEDEPGLFENIAAPSREGGDAEASALLNQQRAFLARALALLPEKERAALVLRDLEGLSTEEVASILGSRPVTVRSQISSARQKLKRYCERWLKGGRDVETN
ncbi:MAG: RNA polymerase sigma factor [Acidobacteriota bacterium]|jgi:RNA polymerase sigma-70 factor (ECF subfamily)|nr:RNA polymerase sigma factor [Acidobacteriota bacterium]